MMEDEAGGQEQELAPPSKNTDEHGSIISKDQVLTGVSRAERIVEAGIYR
jgi:hypothetical protein